MRYSQAIREDLPAYVILVVDQSTSTSEPCPPSATRRSKADVLADTANNALLWLMRASVKDGKEVLNYFMVSVLGYGSKGGRVHSLLGGTLRGLDVFEIRDLALKPLRMEKEEPKWIDPYAEGEGSLNGALSEAHRLAKQWIVHHYDSFPPLVVHISGSDATDGYPERIVQAWHATGTRDGQLLFFNSCQCLRYAAVSYPSREEDLPTNSYVQWLFSVSSELPQSATERASKVGHLLRKHARGFLLNGDVTGLLESLYGDRIGEGPSWRRRLREIVVRSLAPSPKRPRSETTAASSDQDSPGTVLVNVPAVPTTSVKVPPHRPSSAIIYGSAAEPAEVTHVLTQSTADAAPLGAADQIQAESPQELSLSGAESRFFIRRFRLAKALTELRKCEDMIAVNQRGGRFAVTDGAGEGDYSGYWALALAFAWLRAPETIRFHSWKGPSSSDEFQVGFKQVSASFHKHVEKWRNRIKRQIGPLSYLVKPTIRTQFAAFVGLEITANGQWYALAKGDSCLFFESDYIFYSFPIRSPAEFTSRPSNLVPSSFDTVAGAFDKVEETCGRCREGERFLLMTDAIASWYLCHPDRRSTLRELMIAGDNERLVQLVTTERTERRLRDDDIAVLLVQVRSKPPWQ
jgi:hypothetical protein